jgi:acid phosphatase type 7
VIRRFAVLFVLAAMAGVLVVQQAPAGAEDPIVLAAGDIACAPGDASNPCRDEDTAALLAGNLAAVLPLGDNQYESGELSNYLAVYDRSWGVYKAHTYPVPGNHEYRTPNASGYFDYFGGAAGDPAKGYYSYNIGNWHLVALNSNCNTATGRGVAGGCDGHSPMVQWLKQDLEADPHACELVYFHHPRFTSETPSKKSMHATWREALIPNGVDVVLSGHSHTYERFGPQNEDGVATPAGARQFVVGTGGKNTRPFPAGRLPNSEAANDNTMGVLALTLHSASYTWSFMAIDGQSFMDTGDADCH